MSQNRAYTGTKTSDLSDMTKSEFPLQLGIYKGIVKKIDSSTRSGKIFCYIPQFGGDDPDNANNWQTLTYASPFGGATIGQPQGGYPSQVNQFFATKQSYGFFASPPDVNSLVLCCFPGGDKQEGYWFACISSDLSRYMTPAIGAVPLSKIEPLSIPQELLPLLSPGNSYPVSEFNENDKKVFNSNWANNLRPLHIPQTLRLIQQGLDSDISRGAISSSMQRDPVSTVYGMSTPGRPVPQQDPANLPDLREKLRTGDFTTADFPPTSTRVGGHSFVMDDGDIFNNSNLVRLKTASGHQIMLNDTDGFVYIANASGNAWVELTKEGDILLYGARDMAVRTQGNLMMTSDKTISFQAGVSVNFAAGSRVAIEAPIIQANADRVLNLFGRQAQVKSGGILSLSSGSNMVLNAASKMSLKGSAIALNGGGGGGSIAEPNPLPRFAAAESVNVGGRWVVQPGAFGTINYKVPTHEPYVRGSVAALVAFQQQVAADAATAAGGEQQTDVGGNPISPPTAAAGDNVLRAKAQAVSGQAPPSSFISQRLADSPMGKLDIAGVTAFQAQIGHTTSNGRYAAYTTNVRPLPQGQ